MLKQDLRSIYKTRRSELGSIDINQRIFDLNEKFLQFEHWPTKNQYILSYKPIAKYQEIEVEDMEQYFLDRNKDCKIVYPKMEADNETINAYHSSIFKENSWQILEPQNGTYINPEDIDIVFVPLLCFDEKGYRVGYGKGYYDRYLARTTKAIKIGLSFFEPIPHISDKNEFDLPLDFCITPKKVYNFLLEASPVL